MRWGIYCELSLMESQNPICQISLADKPDYRTRSSLECSFEREPTSYLEGSELRRFEIIRFTPSEMEVVLGK
jgi:hypothetical protein